MNAEEIEQLLVRYRPAAPHAETRGRVLAAGGRPRRVPLGMWEFGMAAAAAALVVAAVVTSPRQPAQPLAAEAEWRTAVEQKAALIGGPAATEIAEALVEWPAPFREPGE